MVASARIDAAEVCTSGVPHFVLLNLFSNAFLLISSRAGSLFKSIQKRIYYRQIFEYRWLHRSMHFF